MKLTYDQRQRGSRTPPEWLRAYSQRWRAGVPCKTIAKELRLPVALVRNRIKRAQKTHPQLFPPWKMVHGQWEARVVEQLHRRWMAGANEAALARQVALPRNVVRYLVNKARHRDPGQFPKRQIDPQLRSATMRRLSRQWQAGRPVSEMAQELGIRAVALYGRINRNRNWQLFPRRVRRWDAAADRRLSQRWKAGATMKQLAKEFDRPLTSINSRIHDLRQRHPDWFPLRSFSYVDRMALVEKLSQRWKAGATTRELMTEFRMSERTLNCLVSNLRKRFPRKFPFRHARLFRPD